MMLYLSRSPASLLRREVRAGTLLWLGVAVLAMFPTPLVPVARLYHALCVPFPVLAHLGRLVPPLPLGLLLLVAGVGTGTALVSGLREIFGARRLARSFARQAAPAPPRLVSAARQLDLEDRLIYLPLSTPAAFCFGLLVPRVAITAGLLDRLGDTELIAVLLHERHHQWRRDPLRYLLLHVVVSGLFMLPLAGAAKRWVETRIELAADRAALAVVPRGALAGALIAALTGSTALPTMLASLSATEARIAHLSGRSEVSTVPRSTILATVVLLGGLILVLTSLTTTHQLWELVCTLCPGLE